MKHFEKILVTFIVAMVTTTAAFGQTSQVATLSHNGVITSFYGVDGLKEAYNVAANGDVITLSSGAFNAVNIAKAITVRGAGMDTDVETNRMRTTIIGDFSLLPSEEDTKAKLLLEGLYCNGSIQYNNNVRDAVFMKCRFGGFSYPYGYGNYSCFSFIQCKVFGQLWLTSNCFADVLNSFVYFPHCEDQGTSVFNFTNCIVSPSEYQVDAGRGVYSSSFVNCVIVPCYFNGLRREPIPSSNSVHGCIAVGNYLAANYFVNIQGDGGNVQVNGYDMFKTFRGTFSDNADFEFTDEFKEQYPNVGWYAGAMPFETTPSNPQITKFDVSPKTEADGTLKVDIKVGVAK